MQPIIDRAIVEGIRDIGGRRDNDVFLRELFNIFLENADLTVASLIAAVDRGDLNKIRQYAHRLKGSAANIGAAYLASCCRSLENLAKRGETDPDTLRLALDAVQDAMRRSVASYQAELATPSS